MYKLLILMALSLSLSLTGCSKEVAGGAAVGAVGAGAAYEWQADKAMEDLKEEREAGKISQDEYERRKEEIEKRSLLQ
jgi:osmotically-inducible protein OsmY